MEPITIDTILTWLKESVEQKRIIDAHTWVDAAQKLNVLIGDEHDKLFNLQQQVAIKKAALIVAGDSVAKAKALSECWDEYREMKRQEAKIGQIEEAIRIAKVQSRLKDNETRSY